MGVTFLPEALEHFHPSVQSVVESGIATGSICALVLNMVMPKRQEEPMTALEAEVPAQPRESALVEE